MRSLCIFIYFVNNLIKIQSFCEVSCDHMRRIRLAKNAHGYMNPWLVCVFCWRTYICLRFQILCLTTWAFYIWKNDCFILPIRFCTEIHCLVFLFVLVHGNGLGSSGFLASLWEKTSDLQSNIQLGQPFNSISLLCCWPWTPHDAVRSLTHFAH